MATIYSRCVAYAKNNNTEILPAEVRKEVGRIAAALYHEKGIKRYLHRKEYHEPEGTFSVILYPKLFNQDIDAIISDFHNGRRYMPDTETVPCGTFDGTETKPKARKRIKIKGVKQYSSSLKRQG